MDEWIITDPSCNQMCKVISDTIFEFKEDRIIEPITRSIKEYRSIIDLDDYSIHEIIECLKSYGYTEFLKKFIDCEGNEISNQIIAECLFEQEI